MRLLMAADKQGDREAAALVTRILNWPPTRSHACHTEYGRASQIDGAVVSCYVCCVRKQEENTQPCGPAGVSMKYRSYLLSHFALLRPVGGCRTRHAGELISNPGFS
jgi:hypothetical protein